MIVIVDIFKEIVSKVSQELTPEFAALDGLITGVHYLHGHPLEVVDTLTQRDQTKEFRYQKYPLIALFQDFPETVISNPEPLLEATLNIVIAKSTQAEYTSTKRYDVNLKPFLYPVYKELLRQIHKHPQVLSYGTDRIQHTKYDRVFWGRQGLYGNEGNIGNDKLDAIEIQNLKLKFKRKC